MKGAHQEGTKWNILWKGEGVDQIQNCEALKVPKMFKPNKYIWRKKSPLQLKKKMLLLWLSPM